MWAVLDLCENIVCPSPLSESYNVSDKIFANHNPQASRGICVIDVLCARFPILSWEEKTLYNC